ncbi:hypothetical protein AVEN_71969-1 [Araneus ventricosus]|uniref:Uncharacterized protein n=1 Tax=Araneus ventricosus TaxID=182803 RepID=A0A4Y2F773_ARAVE|nr:hypothetical protein AVEN_71969-1 [Araneus ventricosus]
MGTKLQIWYIVSAGHRRLFYLACTVHLDYFGCSMAAMLNELFCLHLINLLQCQKMQRQCDAIFLIVSRQSSEIRNVCQFHLVHIKKDPPCPARNCQHNAVVNNFFVHHLVMEHCD